MRTHVETVIIGGGQAGLALGYHLQRAGRRFVILEGADRVGDSWRRRWDSLTLFTPRRYDALPGMTFPGDPEGCPGKDEVADYLETYAARFELPVRLAEPVTSLRRDGLGGFTVETSVSVLEAEQVVVATGGFTGPAIPQFAAGLDPRIAQFHSTAYRNPASIPGRTILVVGGGNTGVQIAQELAGDGRQVALSVSTMGKAMPQRVLGRSLFWWFEMLGTMDATPETGIGRRLKNENTIVGTDLKALFRQVERVAKAVGVDGDEILLADGSRFAPDSVVWATGFRPSYTWLHLPVLDEAGMPIHTHGITDVPGLTFLGLPWQRNRGSALLGWVGRDAALLAEHLARPAVARRGRTAEARMPSLT